MVEIAVTSDEQIGRSLPTVSDNSSREGVWWVLDLTVMPTQRRSIDGFFSPAKAFCAS